MPSHFWCKKRVWRLKHHNSRLQTIVHKPMVEIIVISSAWEIQFIAPKWRQTLSSIVIQLPWLENITPLLYHLHPATFKKRYLEDLGPWRPLEAPWFLALHPCIWANNNTAGRGGECAQETSASQEQQRWALSWAEQLKPGLRAPAGNTWDPNWGLQCVQSILPHLPISCLTRHTGTV